MPTMMLIGNGNGRIKQRHQLSQPELPLVIVPVGLASGVDNGEDPVGELPILWEAGGGQCLEFSL